MSPWRTIRRGAYRVARTVRYGWRASVDASRSSTDVLYPEYDAYDRRPRRLAPIVAILLLAAAGVLGTYLALAHGLGNLLLGSFTSKTDPNGTSQVAQVPSGAPTPYPAPPASGTPRPAPTVTITSVGPGAHLTSTSTPTVTASPSRKKHDKPTPTPTGPAPTATTTAPDPGPTTPEPEGSTPNPPPSPSPSESTGGS
jgi:hypothetical protein